MTDVMLVDDSTANVYVRRQDDNPGVTKGWPSSMILVMPNANRAVFPTASVKGASGCPTGTCSTGDVVCAAVRRQRRRSGAAVCAGGAVNRCWWTHGRKPKGSTIGLLGCR